jgi:inhibitor of KinA
VSTYPRLLPAGDSALVVEFGSQIDPAINQRVHALAALISVAPLMGIVECVPTYRSLLIHYDSLLVNYQALSNWLVAQLPDLEEKPPTPARFIEVPTVYGGITGPDLDSVAQRLGLTLSEIIQLHSTTEYTVYMMGFTPGYPYMGKLDSRLQLPRLDTPRTLVPAGSVAIAGLQTGIYPLASPGGWHVIGHTSLKLFDPNRAEPFLFAPGDRVRFTPV